MTKGHRVNLYGVTSLTSSRNHRWPNLIIRPCLPLSPSKGLTAANSSAAPYGTPTRNLLTPAWPKTSAPNRTSATASVATGFGGSRKRTLSTRAGDIEIALPKLRQGSYYPEFLERRRRIDQALYGVIMTAYIKGVSTRKVDKLVEAMGVNAGISRSEVSRICKCCRSN